MKDMHTINDQEAILKVLASQKQTDFDAPLKVNNTGISFAPVLSKSFCGIVEAYRATLNTPIIYTMFAKPKVDKDDYATAFMEVMEERCRAIGMPFLASAADDIWRGFLTVDGNEQHPHPVVLRNPVDFSCDNERLKLMRTPEFKEFKEAHKKKKPDKETADAMIDITAAIMSPGFVKIADVITDQDAIRELINHFNLHDFKEATKAEGKSCLGYVITPTSYKERHYMIEGMRDLDSEECLMTAYCLPSSMPQAVRAGIWDLIRKNRLKTCGLEGDAELAVELDLKDPANLLNEIENQQRNKNKRKEN